VQQQSAGRKLLLLQVGTACCIDHCTELRALPEIGEVLYVRDIRMKPKFRQKGLACFALKYLMRKLSQRQQEYSHPSQWWFAGKLTLNMCQPFNNQAICDGAHNDQG